MRYILQMYVLLFPFLSLSAQTYTCLFSMTYPFGEEMHYSTKFSHEQEYIEHLHEFSRMLVDLGAYKASYLMHEAPDYAETHWNDMIANMQQAIYWDANPLEEWGAISSSSHQGTITLCSWDEAVADPQPQTEEAKPFFALRLSSRDKKNIKILLSDLADKSYLQLLVEKNSMNRKGDRVRVVHPLRFIGHILSDPFLRHCLKSIERDHLKFSEFVKGFEGQMEQEAKKQDLSLYAPGFAQLLQAEEKTVLQILQSKKYIDLISTFL